MLLSPWDGCDQLSGLGWGNTHIIIIMILTTCHIVHCVQVFLTIFINEILSLTSDYMGWVVRME